MLASLAEPHARHSTEPRAKDRSSRVEPYITTGEDHLVTRMCTMCSGGLDILCDVSRYLVAVGGGCHTGQGE
jgi:hypothetical protein